MNYIRYLFGNPYFAVCPRDRFGVVYFLSYILFSLCYTLIVVLPRYHQGPIFYVNYFLLVFLYGNIYISFYKVASNSSHVAGQHNDGILVATKKEVCCDRRQDEDKDFCDVCNIVKPPRSFHCRKCNVCVERRDHHCVLNGVCIGVSNQRYYLSLALYVAITATHFNVYNLPLVADHLKEHSGIVVPFCFLAPHILLILGILDVFEFFVYIVTLKSFAGLFFSYGILLHQLTLIVSGQTRHERKTNVCTYDRGTFNNIRDVLGRRWYLSWACPLLQSPLPEVDFIHQESSKIV